MKLRQSLQMDTYNLEKWQKDRVRKGLNSLWDFEDSDDLEEGDYYYEDD